MMRAFRDLRSWQWRPVDLLLVVLLLLLSVPLWWGWLYPAPPREGM